jgi:hypothetical protein
VPNTLLYKISIRYIFDGRKKGRFTASTVGQMILPL